MFYINIPNSHTVRRSILETSKNTIEALHSFEKFKAVRAQKIKAMEELIILFRQINDISAQLKIEMPKIKLPQFAQKAVKKAKEEKKEPEKEFKHESEDELQKLETAINQIESRLNDIK